MQQQIELEEETIKARQRALCDKIIPSIFALFTKEAASRSIEMPDVVSVIFTTLATLIYEQGERTGFKDLESIRELLAEIRTNLLNSLAAQGWE